MNFESAVRMKAMSGQAMAFEGLVVGRPERERATSLKPNERDRLGRFGCHDADIRPIPTWIIRFE